MTSVRRQLTLPPLKPLIERASGMRVFESDEIVDRASDARIRRRSTSASPAWCSSSAAASLI